MGNERYPKYLLRAVNRALAEQDLNPDDVAEWDAEKDEDGVWQVRVRMKPRPEVNVTIVKEEL